MNASAKHRQRAIDVMRELVGARPAVYADDGSAVVDSRHALAEEFVDECLLAAKLAVEEAKPKSV